MPVRTKFTSTWSTPWREATLSGAADLCCVKSGQTPQRGHRRARAWVQEARTQYAALASAGGPDAALDAHEQQAALHERTRLVALFRQAHAAAAASDPNACLEACQTLLAEVRPCPAWPACSVRIPVPYAHVCGVSRPHDAGFALGVVTRSLCSLCSICSSRLSPRGLCAACLCLIAALGCGGGCSVQWRCGPLRRELTLVTA